MNRYPKVGEKVKIMNDIGKDFVDDMIAVVESRDGEYIYVRTLKKRVLIERYICELEPYPPENESPGQRSERIAALYKAEPGITYEYEKGRYGTAARIRTGHFGVELWRYRFSWESKSLFRDIDCTDDKFSNIFDFMDYAEACHEIKKRKRKK